MENKKESVLQTTGGIVVLASLCNLLWGSAIPFIHLGYRSFAMDSSDTAVQILFAGLRFTLAGLIPIVIRSVMLKKPAKPKTGGFYRVAVLALTQTIAQYFFYYIGLAHTTGVKGAIIVAANVFTAILISSLLYKQEALTARKLAGCAVGFAGIVLINAAGLAGARFSLLGDGCVFLCTVASGFSQVYMKRFSADESPVLLSGWQFAFGGAVMWLFGAVCGGSIRLEGAAAWGILVYLAFVSAAAYSLWAMLLQHNPVSRVTVFGFLNPMCGVILSSLLLHERGAFGIVGAVSLLLVCAGICIVNVQTKRAQDGR